MIFKLLTTLMIAMFTYAIVVQFNDPDTMFWSAMYGIALVTSIAAFMNVSARGMLWIAFGMYAAAVVWLFPAFEHSSLEAFASVGMKNVQQEMVRELWGMVICACWTMILIIHDGIKFPAHKNSDSTTSEADELVCN